MLTGPQVGDDLPRGDLQGGEEVHGAVALVVVGGPGRGGRQHGQRRRGPVERLDLRFLVHREHRRRDRRAHVEGDEVPDLLDEVRAGGHLSAWVYGAENNGWITRFVNPLRERFTSRISRRALLHLSKLPTAAVYAATKLVYGPLNRRARSAALARRLFYNDYLSAISGFGWREQHTIVFDHLVAPTAQYVTREEFEKWWESIDASETAIGWHNKNSWRGLGRLPEEKG